MYDQALWAEGNDPIRNLALEESMLERGFGSDSALLLYVDDPCVVVGRNQNPWIEAAPGSGLPVLRRVSGGGTVYHDRGNLNWCIIVPRRAHDREAELDQVAGVLRRIGVPARQGPRGGLFYDGGGEHDGAKVSGTARRITATRVLHHGTLLVEADLRRLGSSLGGIETESTRSLPSVPSRSMNVSAVAPGLSLGDLVRAFARGLCGRDPAEASALVDRGFAEESARRLSSWEWTWGATPAFSIALPWKGGRATLEVRGGVVASIAGPGSERLSGLAGRRFDYCVPAAAVAAMESSRGSE